MVGWFHRLFYGFGPEATTLQDRYPAGPGAYVTSYSSIDLPDEAFVPVHRVALATGGWVPCPHCLAGAPCPSADPLAAARDWDARFAAAADDAARRRRR